MASFALSLKREIGRIARKELKSEIDSLRKSCSAQRTEIAALKRQIRELEATQKNAARQQKAAGRDKPVDRSSEGETVATGRGRRVAYSSEMLVGLRSKLGITQAQMSKLLGVSTLSVYKWEKGGVMPRESQKQKILALRKTGKRSVAQLLAASE